MAVHIDEAKPQTPRGLQDCYFFYYSTCNKGDRCEFRHEPAALGSETVCQLWQQGKCSNMQCPLRHMQLKKNRKTIPCYWEAQPSGCRKPHCAFQHKAPREIPANGVNQTSHEPNIAGRTPLQEVLIANFQASMNLY